MHRPRSISWPSALSVLGALLITSCATVTKGTHDTIHVVTEPAGASAFTDILKNPRQSRTDYIGCAPTPCRFDLPRRTEAVLQIDHTDYASLEVGIISDHRKERAYRARKRADAKTKDAKAKNAILSENGKLGLGASAATYAIGSLEAGAIVIPATGAGLVLAGSMFYVTASSYTLAANTTDTITGASYSLFPSAIGVRLSKDAADYAPDPTVAGVRQRRRVPSPKPPLSTTAPPPHTEVP